jgi:hypothetical protein
MLHLRCTNAVQKAFSIKSSDLENELLDEAIWGSWYVNILDIGRKKSLIFVSEKTLMSFVHVGVKKSECTKEKLPFIFYDGLFRLVQMMGLSANEISKVMDSHHSWSYAKTDSRSMLGNMNELVSHYQYFLHPESDEISDHELFEFMSTIIMKNIDYRKPIDVAISIVRSAAT